MFDTTKDILWFVLAISIGLISVLLAWVLFQVGRLVRQSNEIVEDIRAKITTMTGLITTMAEKVNSHTSTMVTVAKGIEQVLSFVKTKRQTRKRRTSNGE